MARRDDDSDDAPQASFRRGWRRERATPGEAPEPEPEGEGPDPDRLIRLRLVFAFVSLLVGSFALLVATAILSIVLSGRVDLPVAAGALLIAAGSVLLLLRAVLRTLSSRRPGDDELRSLAGFVSLGTGLVLLAAVAVFLLLTVIVLLRGSGEAAFFILPLAVLAYFTLQFLREATDDFLKRVDLRRETGLFLTSIAYYALTVLVAQLLFAASTASPIVLRSPADGAFVPAGAVIDFEITETGVASVSFDTGAGAQPLASPYDINTSGWPDGAYNITVKAVGADGSSVSKGFHFTVDSTAPLVSASSPSNHSAVPAGTPLDFVVSDAHLSRVVWMDDVRSPLTNPATYPLPPPYDLDTSSWGLGSYNVTVAATDAAGNVGSLTLRVTIT